MENETAPRIVFVSEMSGQVYAKAAPSTGEPGTPILSVVTYPTKDYAGDRVRPDGGDWTKYPEHPYVNWSHRCPIGRGTVKHRLLKFEGETTPVAVGTTTFLYTKADLEGLDLRRRDPRTHRSWDKEPPYTVDEVLEASMQAERLIRDDIAPGVSIEFDVDEKRKGTDWWDLNERSLLENRPARHFEVWRGLGYAHARQPVNPGCLTLKGQPRVNPRMESVEKAIRVAQTGKLPGGEPVCEIILKSFDDLKSYRSATMVLVKGDVPTSTSTDTADAPSAHADAAGGPKMGAGHRAMINFSQGLNDLCTRIEEEGAESDDLSVRKYIRKVCAKAKDLAGDVLARAEKHASKLNGNEKDDDDNPMDEDDYSPSAEEKAINTDAEGFIVVKSFPNWKPRRMTFKDIAETPAIPATPETKSIEDTVSPEEEKRARKRLRKAMAQVQPLLEAAQANGLI